MRKSRLSNLAEIGTKYFYIYSDCFFTKGIKRSLLTDISRQKSYPIDSEYYDLLVLLRKKNINDVLSLLKDKDDIRNFMMFLSHLEENDLGEVVDDISLFPEIEKIWDYPADITNSIIDVRNILHDFECIFYQLDELGCESIQIRIYKEIGYEELLEIVKKSSNLNFRYLNILIPYPLMDDFMFQLIRMTENYTYIHLSLYNTPIDIVKQKKKVPRISLIHQNISSANDCGVINRKNLSFFSIQTYMENILYNSCLNRKICIDEFGDIKNCPSMSFSYGNIISYKLKDVSSKESFRKYWQINKSQISVCKDCEYRNMCSDCRAFICNEKDIYSKPLKCNYDPYQCCWEK